MENQDFLTKRLEERMGLLKGTFGKSGRKVQALKDACKSLFEENDALRNELEAKNKLITGLTDYLNQCMASLPSDEEPSIAPLEESSELKA